MHQRPQIVIYNTRIEGVLFHNEYSDLRSERSNCHLRNERERVERSTSYECTLDPCIVHYFFVQMHRQYKNKMEEQLLKIRDSRV